MSRSGQQQDRDEVQKEGNGNLLAGGGIPTKEELLGKLGPMWSRRLGRQISAKFAAHSAQYSDETFPVIQQ